MTYAPQDQSAWRYMARRVERWTRCSGKAEDLLQSAFARMLAYGQPIANVDSFLMRVAGNIAIDEDRRDRSRPVEHLSSDLQDIMRGDDPLPDEVIDSRARLAAVSAAIDGLPDRTRRIFLMHRLDGYKYREIAEIEVISVSAVEKHIAKAALCISDWRES